MFKKTRLIFALCLITICCVLNVFLCLNMATVVADEYLNPVNQIVQNVEDLYQVSIIRSETLSDFEGETRFYLLEGERSYFIINIQTNSIFERSIDSNFP